MTHWILYSSLYAQKDAEPSTSMECRTMKVLVNEWLKNRHSMSGIQSIWILHSPKKPALVVACGEEVPPSIKYWDTLFWYTYTLKFWKRIENGQMMAIKGQLCVSQTWCLRTDAVSVCVVNWVSVQTVRYPGIPFRVYLNESEGS